MEVLVDTDTTRMQHARILNASAPRDSGQPDDLLVELRGGPGEPVLVGETADYSAEFLAALERFKAGDLDGALVAFEAMLAEHDGQGADADALSVASAALNRASILSLKGNNEAAIAAFDSAFRRFGDNQKLATFTEFSEAYAKGRDHQELLCRRLRNERLAWPGAILIYALFAAAMVALKRRLPEGSSK